MFAVSLLMGFLDIFAMMGISRFSLETYLGSLILDTTSGSQIWIAFAEVSRVS